MDAFLTKRPPVWRKCAEVTELFLYGYDAVLNHLLTTSAYTGPREIPYRFCRPGRDPAAWCSPLPLTLAVQGWRRGALIWLLVVAVTFPATLASS